MEEKEIEFYDTEGSIVSMTLKVKNEQDFEEQKKKLEKEHNVKIL